MKHELWVVVQGERFVALETVAESYAFEVSWVHAVYEQGLLGEGRVVDRQIVITLAMLDRVAEIRRLNRYLGLDLESIGLWLARAPG